MRNTQIERVREREREREGARQIRHKKNACIQLSQIKVSIITDVAYTSV